jgi:ABC-type multidrug transport system fused ATPase/permease subunit
MQILSVVKRDFTGNLLYNGLPKANLHLRSLRDHIGDLSSQEDLFKGTIHENLTVGNERITMQRVLQIVEQVGLNEFIRSHPDGLETELLPAGKNIPGSIITKILVARSILPQPKLLVMESMVGNLNFRDRLRMAQLVTDKSQPWTLVTVTEDPLLASMCDRIIVMKEGEIVFDGTFDDLQKTSHYEKIFRTQNETSF